MQIEEPEINRDIVALASRKQDDLEDHVVSSTSRNRYYHPVLGLRVRALKELSRTRKKALARMHELPVGSSL